MIEVRCTVRGCGATIPPIAAEQRARASAPGSIVLRGPCGHCFDIARSGYINLLQPQDSRAREPGDAAAAVAARRRLLDAGAGSALLEALATAIHGLGLPPGARTLDIGAGEGSLLGALAERFGLDAVGVELSARAADLAARRHHGVLWLVANADRGLPFPDSALDLALSITARRSPVECARVLVPGGHLLVAIPAPDDLAELREAALGTAAHQDMMPKLIEEHETRFELLGRIAASARLSFTTPQLEDLLVSTYRSGRAGRRERVAALDGLEVTLSHQIAIFRRRDGTV